MSCHSCSGCFTGSDCSTTKITKKDVINDKARFHSLLELAVAANHLKPEEKEHDHVVPTIMADLSKNIYSSQTVLFQAYDTLSQPDFISLSKYLYESKIIGVHIAWAAEYCQNNAERLLEILKSDDEQKKVKLFQHCNDQAEIHEMFSQLPSGSVGRVNMNEA